LQGLHNAEAVVAHADFLLQQYLRRQILLSEIKDNAAALLLSNQEKFSHVATVNAGLVADAAKVRFRSNRVIL
jgi:hypothetical protein